MDLVIKNSNEIENRILLLQLAKQLGLQELHQVEFFEPFMRKSVSIPGQYPLDNEVIEKFVSEHKRATLRKLRPLDMYDTWVCT